MVASSKDAMQATSQTCSDHFHWRDYQRFNNNQCLSFGSRTNGGIAVSLAEMPSRPEGKVVMDIGVAETKLMTFDKASKEWKSQWKSTDNLALVGFPRSIPLLFHDCDHVSS